MKSAFETIKDNGIGKTLGWCGLIVGVLGILVSVYYGRFKKDEPKLEYDIVSATDFFNNSESAPYIKVFIKDTIDVQKNHQNITVYKIKVENKGTKHINNDEYYKGFFGLKIDYGTLLDIPLLLSASDSYIEESFYKDMNIDLYTKTNSIIELPKTILDIDDNYVIKVVLLHDIDSIPKFNAVGKITGQKRIVFNEAQENNHSFWSSTFGGIWSIHFVRFWIYFIIGLALLLFVNYLASKNEEKKVKKKRKNEIITYETNTNDSLTSSVKDEYINNGAIAINSLYSIFMENESEITEKYRKMAQYILQRKNNIDIDDFSRVKKEYNMYNDYIRKSFFSLNNDLSIAFNINVKESIIKLNEFLVKKSQEENKLKSVEYILNKQSNSS
jgi:hypothetical protein